MAAIRPKKRSRMSDRFSKALDEVKEGKKIEEKKKKEEAILKDVQK